MTSQTVPSKRASRRQGLVMASESAGILLHRVRDGRREVLLVHPGGPFWARRDTGAWSIPKGEYGPDEDPVACALREFEEELGAPPPAAEDLVELGTITQRGGKRVTAWAAPGDLDPDAWFGLEDAREKINPAQADLLDRMSSLP